MPSCHIEHLANSKGGKYVFFNARSVVSNFDMICTGFDHTKISFIAISETWLTDKIPDSLITMQNFCLVRLDRKEDKRGGGALIYVNKDISYTTLSPDLNFSNENIECLTIQLAYPYQKPFFITSVYLPPKADRANSFETLIHLYDSLGISDQTWIIGGDFNVNHTNTSSLKNKFMDKFE